MHFITCFILWMTVSERMLPVLSATNAWSIRRTLPDDSGERPDLRSDNNSTKCSSTPLHLAMGLVRLLINQGADLQAIDCEGMTPHDLAVKSNIEEIIHISYSEIKIERKKHKKTDCSSTPLHLIIQSIIRLIEQGQSLEAVDCQHLTPRDIVILTSDRLVLAVPYSEDEVEENMTSTCNRTALHRAVINKDIRSIFLKLQRKENMYALDCTGMTPMELAIYHNNREAISMFIKAQYDVNKRLSGKQNLLQRAISIGNVEAVKFLFEMGINKGLINKDTSSSLLFDALLSNKTDIVRFLIDHGAKLDYANEDRNTYVHKFSENGITHALVALNSLNALNTKLVNALNAKNESALSLAVKGNYPAVVKILLANGAKTNNLVEGGKTYLHIAIERGSRDALHALLESGIPADSKDSSGITPILLAVREDDSDFMSILKKFGSNLKQTFGNSSNSLLHEAALSDSAEALSWLLNNGHTIDEENSKHSTALHIAVKNRQIKMVQLLLQRKANMYAVDSEGMTPMDLALLGNNHDIILAFIKAQFDVNRKLGGKQNLLHRAISIGNIDTVKFLLHLEIYKGVLEREGSSLLIEALLSNKIEVFQYMIDHGAKLNYKNENDDTYVHKFSEEGNTQALILLKKLNLINTKLVNTINKKNETSLYKAVKNNYAAVVKILLDSGANTSILLEGGKTYLHIAIERGSRDALHALLESGIPPDSKDSSGIPPILLAVRKDDSDSMAILKKFGSDLKQTFGTHQKESLLHEAASSGSTKALAWLLDNGHTVDEKNNQDFTALHYAARFGKAQTVKFLLSRNANVNAATVTGDKPLHWASVNGELTIIKDLILKGADVNAKQKFGFTPLHLAAYYGHLPAVEELLSKGAEVNALSKPGYTPLHYAVQQNHTKIANYIKSKGGH